MNICFITNELHPFKPGGIGRLMYNFAVQNRDHATRRCNFFFLIASSDVADTRELEEYFEVNDLGVVVGTPAEFSFLGAREAKLFQALGNNYSAAGFIRKSIEYYNGLMYLEAKYGIKLDVIEFPDYGGWGFTTLSAKCAGINFLDARIVVRLHSTGGLIHDAEPFYHRKGAGERSFSELERQCIQQADLVVSHLPVITEVNQKFYGFDESWLEKVIHEFPPIFLEKEEIFSNKSGATKDFIFSSRLQPFKRPDLFVKAAVIFLDRHPGYEGRFYVVSYGWDNQYIDWLCKLVPERHKDLVLFIFNADANLRNRLLQQSIAVIPSNYESLCVFAYESALRGAKIILNRECLAFGKADYWKEGKNCLQFNGSAEDLADVYEQVLSIPEPILQPLPESLCYWHLDNLPVPVVKNKPYNDGVMAVIAYGLNSLAKANERLFELSSLLVNPKFELHLIINVGFSEFLVSDLPENVKIHYCSWDIPNPTYIKSLLSNIDAEYVAFLPPNGQVMPDFYTQAQKALNTYQDLLIVTSAVRALTEVDAIQNQDWQEGDRDDYGGEGCAKLSVGGAPSLAHLQVDIVSEFSCFRLNGIGYKGIHEESGEFFLSLLLNRAIRNGAKVLVIPKLYITELPSQAAYLKESAMLDTVAG